MKATTKREVYIGDGKTIEVYPSETSVKEFDWNKLQEYFNTHKHVEAGMKEDWFFTGSNVTQEKIDDKCVNGLYMSDWATPSILINDEFIDCYIEVPIKLKE